MHIILWIITGCLIADIVFSSIIIKFEGKGVDKIIEANKININFVMDEDTPNKFKVISRVVFEKYEIKGVIKTLESFMSEYKTYYYKCQRAYDKANEKKNKHQEGMDK
jgi:hypothetical protein